MKQWAANYAKAIQAWDSKHRLIGRERPEVLIEQTLEALATLPEGLKDLVLVDVGAGAGFLGICWAHEGGTSLLIEPQAKKASFIAYYLSQHPEISLRVKVVACLVEDVSRETLGVFNKPVFGVSRAFSGIDSLETTLLRAKIDLDPFFVFENDQKDQKFSLRPLKKIPS